MSENEKLNPVTYEEYVECARNFHPVNKTRQTLDRMWIELVQHRHNDAVIDDIMSGGRGTLPPPKIELPFSIADDAVTISNAMIENLKAGKVKVEPIKATIRDLNDAKQAMYDYIESAIDKQKVFNETISNAVTRLQHNENEYGVKFDLEVFVAKQTKHNNNTAEEIGLLDKLIAELGTVLKATSARLDTEIAFTTRLGKRVRDLEDRLDGLDDKAKGATPEASKPFKLEVGMSFHHKDVKLRQLAVCVSICDHAAKFRVATVIGLETMTYNLKDVTHFVEKGIWIRVV